MEALQGRIHIQQKRENYQIKSANQQICMYPFPRKVTGNCHLLSLRIIMGSVEKWPCFFGNDLGVTRGTTSPQVGDLCSFTPCCRRGPNRRPSGTRTSTQPGSLLGGGFYPFEKWEIFLNLDHFPGVGVNINKFSKPPTSSGILEQSKKRTITLL